MSATQRNNEKNSANQRNSTAQLEKILLSSSSTNSQRKLGSTDLNKIILTTQDMNSNGGGTQRTTNNGMFNNTGKNWRKLITPGQDSFKRFVQQHPDYSGYNGGGSVGTTTHNAPNIGATTTSNDTSLDQSNMSMSVKQFTPSQQDLKQLKMTLRGAASNETHGNSVISDNKEYMKSKLYVIPDNEDQQKNTYAEQFGASTSQMKSLMKSFSNGNFEFFDNLHKKYFDKAKDKKAKPPTASQINGQQSERDLFTLTSKTNNFLGVSQFKQSVDSYKKPSVLRASSLGDNKENVENAKHSMSINFKNSLYKKINPSPLHDNSSSQINQKILHDRSIQHKALQHYDLDSSEESDYPDKFKDQKKLAESKQAIDIKQHILSNQMAVLGNIPRNKSKEKSRERSKARVIAAMDETLDNNALSRRDLSARHDETGNLSHSTSPVDKDRKNRFHRIHPIDHHLEEETKQRQPNAVYESTNSLNLIHCLLSSGHNNQTAKITSQQSSVLMSNPDFNANSLSQYNRVGDTHIIFEQPTKEDALEDTFKDLKQINKKPGDDLKAEDLTTIIEQACMSNLDSSQMSQQNDILATYKQYAQIARHQVLSSEFPPLQRRNSSCHQNSISVGDNNEGDKQQNQRQNQYQSAALERQRNFIHHSSRNSNLKGDAQAIEQRSDFTFVLSNPTEFQCDCCQQDQNNSFVTHQQKPLFTAPSSDIKTQQPSTYRKNGLPVSRGLQNKLQDLIASPIYSENGSMPQQFVINQSLGNCNNCGGSKLPKPRISNIQHRLSYNQLNHQSIKEESQDEDDEYYQQQQHDSEDNAPVFNKVFDYHQQEPKDRGGIITGETSLENQNGFAPQQHPDEELRKLHTIVSFSQECMSKILQDHSVSHDMKSYLAKVLGVISSAYGSSLGSHFQKPNQAHFISNQTLLQPSIVSLGDNMTMSELYQKQQQQIRKASNNIIHEEVDHDQSSQVLQESICDNQQKISPIYPVSRKVTKKPMPLKSSLISSSCEDPQFNQNREDTILSYFEQDDDCESESEEEERYIRTTIGHRNNKATLRQSEFYENRAAKGKSGLKQSGYKATELKKSFHKTRKSLVQTKTLLKKERYLNREQEDKIRKLEVQIEALTERWKMTEDNLKARENMQNLMLRLTVGQSVSPHSTSQTTAGNVVASTNIGSTAAKSGSASSSSFQGVKRDLSPVCQNVSSHTHNQSHNQGPTTTIQMNTSHLDHSSKHLLEINDRLTKQIEDNLNLFEDLNNELTSKDQIIADNQMALHEKLQEVDRLQKKIQDMSLNMKQLIEITKATTEQTEIQKQKQQEELEHIRKRQDAYQKKINKLNNAISTGIQSSNSTSQLGVSQLPQSDQQLSQQYSKYTNHRQTLNCIQLTSPQSMAGGPSVNTSRINDEELSIGQMMAYRTQITNESDSVPSKQSKSNIINPPSYQRFVNQGTEDNSLLNSNALQSLYQNLKDSVKHYQMQKSGDSSLINSGGQDETTMFKYSQDVTQQSQLFQKTQRTQR